ncbi:hypothetical protein BGW39_005816 [Mortierella sp. 14UC]|nr:hypothetical protein BGW39_005816 [Mortierella sp. 14UC]
MPIQGSTFLLFMAWLCMVVWFSVSLDSANESILVLKTNDTFIARAAAFGPRTEDQPGNEGGAAILSLVAVETLDPSEDRTACRPVHFNSSFNPDNKPWAALVERGGKCGFVDKVKNMMVSGASAVIVGDYEKGPLVTMYSNREDTSDITIPSVFVTQTHYRELGYLGMELGQGFLVRMASDEEDLPVLDAIVFVIVSPLLVFLFLFFLWRMRLRQLRLADLAPPEVVSNLPIKVFFKSKLKENDPVECVICLDEYEDEDELRVLPCRHEYHATCVDNWLTTRKKFCPICKRDICTTESLPVTLAETPTETTPLLGSAPRMETDSRIAVPSTTASMDPSASTPPPLLDMGGDDPSSSSPPAFSYSTALSSGSAAQQPQHPTGLSSLGLGRAGEVTIPLESVTTDLHPATSSSGGTIGTAGSAGETGAMAGRGRGSASVDHGDDAVTRMV